MGQYIGQSVKRVEDQRFITGKGQYTDDITLPGMTYATFIRSPLAHANIKNIDLSAAKNAPGYVASFVGGDIPEAIAGVPCGWQVDFKNGDTMNEPPHPLLARTKALHVGDGIAVVIAETQAQAKDAAAMVEVEYEELPAVTDISEALKDGAPQLHDGVPNNKIFDWELGSGLDAVDSALASASHVTKLDIVNQRLIPNAIEPRCAIGDYDDSRDYHTLYTSSQNPHVIRLLMCAFVLGLPEHKVRVVAPDVGGGFGSKIFHYAEEALMVWAAKQIQNPNKQTPEANKYTEFHPNQHH